MLTQAELHELFTYDPATGELFWRVKTNNRAPAGSRAGYLNERPGGYRVWLVGYQRKLYVQSRLIWCFVHGVWPDVEIDHINGDPSDNRLCNLRLATRKQNNMNRLFEGVDFYKVTRKWRARISVNGKVKSLGYYHKREDAIAARKRAEVEYYGEWRRSA